MGCSRAPSSLAQVLRKKAMSGVCGVNWRNEHIAFCKQQSYRAQFDSHQCFEYTSGGSPRAFPGEACSRPGPCGRLLYELEGRTRLLYGAELSYAV